MWVDGGVVVGSVVGLSNALTDWCGGAETYCSNPFWEALWVRSCMASGKMLGSGVFDLMLCDGERVRWRFRYPEIPKSVKAILTSDS
jgi:hypothetical protein